MRTDAESNRQRILRAAEEVFVELGLDASTDEVARRAGVGVATVFRHFPTKRDLVENALVIHFHALTRISEDAERHPEPTRGFLELLEQLIDHTAPKMAMADFLFGRGALQGPAKSASSELKAVVARVLLRAQQKGRIRVDVDIDVLYFLIRGLAQSDLSTPIPDSTRRNARMVVLEGLVI